MKSRLPLFANGWTPHQCQPSSRFALDSGNNAFTREGIIDKVCAAWHRQFSATSYLESTSPFIQNLSMLENLWLPTSWHKPFDLSLIPQLSEQHLPLLGWSRSDLYQLLDCRPGDLTPALIGKLQILRAALLNPDWIIIDSSWFLDPLLPIDQSLQLTNAMLGASRWLLIGDLEFLVLPNEVAWVKIKLLSANSHD
jgi:hypothetical protein